MAVRVLVMVQSAQGYGRTMLRGIINEASRRPDELELLFHTAPHAGKPPRWLSFDAVIAESDDTERRRWLSRLKCPRVVISGPSRIAGAAWVRADNQEVGRLAADHLIEQGLGRLAFVGYPGRWNSEVRRRGFAAEARRRGLGSPLLAPALKRPDDDWTIEVPEYIEWVRGLPKPIGVLATTEARARQVALACREAQVHMPEEVALVAVGDDELTLHMATPPITSVDHNVERIGAESVWQLRRLLSGEAASRSAVVVRPLGVVVRQSSDTLAVADPQVAAALRYIREHVEEGVTPRDVLKHVAVARRTLELAFSRLLGRTIEREIMRVRLERARTLLLRTDLGMAAIAAASGFAHASHFSAAFKRVMGVSPRDFRSKRKA